MKHLLKPIKGKIIIVIIFISLSPDILEWMLPLLPRSRTSGTPGATAALPGLPRRGRHHGGGGREVLQVDHLHRTLLQQ